MELELRKTVAKVADMKQALAKSSRKVESFERGVKQIRSLMEGIRSDQLGLWSVEEIVEEFPPNAETRPQVKSDGGSCSHLV